MLERAFIVASSRQRYNCHVVEHALASPALFVVVDVDFAVYWLVVATQVDFSMVLASSPLVP